MVDPFRRCTFTKTEQTMLFGYALFLRVFSLGIRIISWFHPKAKNWVEGRSNWWHRLQELHIDPQKPVVWMHCASLGEFEQGRPVLEEIRATYPNTTLVLSFFSPSGYEIRKNYPGADLVIYLPVDGKANAKKLIGYLQPKLVLWVKYEYWYYYLLQLKQQQIPVLLISGIFRASQPFFKWYGSLWKKMLGSFEHLFVQNNHSAILLKNVGFDQKASVAGDTRFDRVCSIAQQWEPIPGPLANFCGAHPVIVAGSTWEEDEALLIHYAKSYPQIRFIIAPHEVAEERIKDLEAEFKQAIRFSALETTTTANYSSQNVLIIDNIGMLSRLYRYATIAYVGGGFNTSGIHNILEAAVYGKPVIVGPVYEKFAEATDLVEAGAAFSVSTALELEGLLNELLQNETLRNTAGEIAHQYVHQQSGATKKIMNYIQEKRLLTN